MNDKPKNIAVIGCGYWGKNLIRNFFEIDALAAVCDADPDQAKKFADMYDVPSMSFDEVLKSDQIEGVVIAAPAALHYKIAKQALEANKHVLLFGGAFWAGGDGHRTDARIRAGRVR